MADAFGPLEGVQLILYSPPAEPAQAAAYLARQQAMKDALALLKEPIQIFTSENTGSLGYIVVGRPPTAKATFIPKGTDDQRQAPGAQW